VEESWGKEEFWPWGADAIVAKRAQSHLFAQRIGSRFALSREIRRIKYSGKVKFESISELYICIAAKGFPSVLPHQNRPSAYILWIDFDQCAIDADDIA